jgi:hypothetical protein
MEKKHDKLFEVHTNAEGRRLGMVAEHRAPPSFDLAVVPGELHDLIPPGRRWGIRCEVDPFTGAIVVHAGLFAFATEITRPAWRDTRAAKALSD